MVYHICIYVTNIHTHFRAMCLKGMKLYGKSILKWPLFQDKAHPY